LVTKLFEGVTLPGPKSNKQIDNKRLTRKVEPDTHLWPSCLFEADIKFKIKVLLKAA